MITGCLLVILQSDRRAAAQRQRACRVSLVQTAISMYPLEPT